MKEDLKKVFLGPENICRFIHGTEDLCKVFYGHENRDNFFQENLVDREGLEVIMYREPLFYRERTLNEYRKDKDRL